MKYLIVWWAIKGKTRSVFQLLSELKIENDTLEFECGRLDEHDCPGAVKVMLKHVLFYDLTEEKPKKYRWE